MRVKVDPVSYMFGYCKIEFTNEIDRLDFIHFLEDRSINFVAEVKPAAQITQSAKDKRSIHVSYVDFLIKMIESMPDYETLPKLKLQESTTAFETPKMNYIDESYYDKYKEEDEMEEQWIIGVQNGNIKLSDYINKFKK